MRTTLGSEKLNGCDVWYSKPQNGTRNDTDGLLARVLAVTHASTLTRFGPGMVGSTLSLTSEYSYGIATASLPTNRIGSGSACTSDTLNATPTPLSSSPLISM